MPRLGTNQRRPERLSTPKVEPNKPMPDPKGCYQWLSTELKHVHDPVKINREEVKLDDKVKYDKAHNAIEPTWKVGVCST